MITTIIFAVWMLGAFLVIAFLANRLREIKIELSFVRSDRNFFIAESDAAARDRVVQCAKTAIWKLRYEDLQDRHSKCLPVLAEMREKNRVSYDRTATL